MITYRPGNAANPPERPAVIVHVVNDVGAWGAGFTASLDERWPQARESYLAWHRRGFERGQGLLAKVGDGVSVAHLAAQAGLRGRDNPTPIDYTALYSCLTRLAKALPEGATVHMPLIGCGLAGGKWERVSKMVAQYLGHREVYVYSDRYARAESHPTVRAVVHALGGTIEVVEPADG